MQLIMSFMVLINLYGSTGEGMGKLSLADRATIANMSPEYGATMGFFPVDHITLQYLKLTGRSEETVSYLLDFLFISCFSKDFCRVFNLSLFNIC